MNDYLAWIVAIAALVSSGYLTYRTIVDYRRWKIEEAEWHRRIQDNWAQLIEAAKRERDDTTKP